MGRRRSAGLFLMINVIVSLSVALLVITLFSSTQDEEEPPIRPSIVVFVTATLDPLLLPQDALQATVDAQAGTLAAIQRNATASVESAIAISSAPTEQGATPRPTQQAVANEELPTIPPNLLPNLPTQSNNTAVPLATNTLPPDGCERYFVQAGDTASKIAEQFEVSLSNLFILNAINDRTILNIGDELLIPGENCRPEVTPTVTQTPRPTFNLTFVAPTVTLAPTVENSQIEITNVLNLGDITAEQVEIQNLGGEINLEGWTLTDGQGNTYTFPPVRLVPGSILRVLTRSGNNTPGFLYWNQNTPMWSPGETATLSNASGAVQSVFTVGEEEG
ncbi:MAG: lamin tail domain-containing protein [Anaerolineae bacterium]|nr:lamin tail domain-containing protein [Anaerolineae bacterium]